MLLLLRVLLLVLVRVQELVVRVTLPGVSSAGAVDLDVGERSLAIKVGGEQVGGRGQKGCGNFRRTKGRCGTWKSAAWP